MVTLFGTEISYSVAVFGIFCFVKFWIQVKIFDLLQVKYRCCLLIILFSVR